MPRCRKQNDSWIDDTAIVFHVFTTEDFLKDITHIEAKGYEGVLV